MSGFFFLHANQPTSQPASQPTLQEKRDPQSLGHCRRAAPRRSSKEGKEERENTVSRVSLTVILTLTWGFYSIYIVVAIQVKSSQVKSESYYHRGHIATIPRPSRDQRLRRMVSFVFFIASYPYPLLFSWSNRLCADTQIKGI